MSDSANSTDFAAPRQRVWFELPEGVDRDRLYDLGAGVLLRETPDHTAISSLQVYPAAQGASEDPRIATVMWELQYVISEAEGRDWDWGHEVQQQLVADFRRAFGA